MGWLRRAVSRANEVAPDVLDPGDAVVVALDLSARRVRKLEANGTPANGVITGIRFSLNDETMRKEFAVTVPDPSGNQRFGIRTEPRQAQRLRLGLPVVVKVDGSRAVLDWPAMTAAWGWPPETVVQDALRKPPADGLEDKAVDWGVQRHLKKWPRTEARIVSLRRCTALGMLTLDWDIELELSDGTRTMSKRDGVPSYAAWDVAVGVTVPAVVDPKDRSRASIDWVAFALSRFGAADFDDDPPPGSIAAEIETGGSAPVPAPPPIEVVGLPGPVTVDTAEGPVVLDPTIRSWLDAHRAGHMSRSDVEKAVRDWHAAGMCTMAQADAARAALDPT